MPKDGLIDPETPITVRIRWRPEAASIPVHISPRPTTVNGLLPGEQQHPRRSTCVTRSAVRRSRPRRMPLTCHREGDNRPGQVFLLTRSNGKIPVQAFLAGLRVGYLSPCYPVRAEPKPPENGRVKVQCALARTVIWTSLRNPATLASSMSIWNMSRARVTVAAPTCTAN